MVEKVGELGVRGTSRHVMLTCVPCAGALCRAGQHPATAASLRPVRYMCCRAVIPPYVYAACARPAFANEEDRYLQSVKRKQHEKAAEGSEGSDDDDDDDATMAASQTGGKPSFNLLDQLEAKAKQLEAEGDTLTEEQQMQATQNDVAAMLARLKVMLAGTAIVAAC